MPERDESSSNETGGVGKEGQGERQIRLGQVDPLLMLVSSDLAVTARSETKIDYTKKRRRSFYVTLLPTVYSRPPCPCHAPAPNPSVCESGMDGMWEKNERKR